MRSPPGSSRRPGDTRQDFPRPPSFTGRVRSPRPPGVEPEQPRPVTGPAVPTPLLWVGEHFLRTRPRAARNGSPSPSPRAPRLSDLCGRDTTGVLQARAWGSWLCRLPAARTDSLPGPLSASGPPRNNLPPSSDSPTFSGATTETSTSVAGPRPCALGDLRPPPTRHRRTWSREGGGDLSFGVSPLDEGVVPACEEGGVPGPKRATGD